jgi:hypothetical protein
MIPNKKVKILGVDDKKSIRTLPQTVLAGQERTILLAAGGWKAMGCFDGNGRTLRFLTCGCRM